MGRATEFLDYINQPKKPTQYQIAFYYPSLGYDEKAEEIRRENMFAKKRADRKESA